MTFTAKPLRTLLAALAMLILPFGVLSAQAAVAPGVTSEKPAISGGWVDAALISQAIGPRDAKTQEVIKVAGRRGRGWRRGRGLAAGIIAGAIGAAIISGAARAHRYDHHPRRRYYGHSRRCESLYWRCEDGSHNACRKFYRYCD